MSPRRTMTDLELRARSALTIAKRERLSATQQADRVEARICSKCFSHQCATCPVNDLIQNLRKEE